MFNIEEAIAEWRQQMRAAGIKTPVPLEELENHLREEIETQMRSGITAEQAFALADERIGNATRLREEFEKAADPLEARKRKRLRALGFSCGLVVPYCTLSISWVIWQRGGKVDLTGTDWFLAFGAIIPTLLFIPVGRFVGRLLPVIIREWLMALACVTALFAGAMMFRFLWSVLWANSLVHMQIALLWTMSPWLATVFCFGEWCDRSNAARKQFRVASN